MENVGHLIKNEASESGPVITDRAMDDEFVTGAAVRLEDQTTAGYQRRIADLEAQVKEYQKWAANV